MKKKSNRQGFTLVELMLAITFLTSLAVLISLLVSNAAATYRRGVTLKRINATGTEIMEDLRATINNNHVGDLAVACDGVYDDVQSVDQCKEDNGFSFVSLKGYKPVTIKGVKEYSVGEDAAPVYGVFCTGMYSYIWNSGYFFDSELYQVGTKSNPAAPITVRYADKDVSNFRLLKVRDEKRAVCVDAVKRYTQDEIGSPSYLGVEDIENMPNFFNLSSLAEEPVELLSGEEADGLAIYDLTVTRPAVAATNQVTFYSGSFILGTVEGGVNIGTTSDYCKAYVDKGISEADYCSVNRFNFALSTSGI